MRVDRRTAQAPYPRRRSNTSRIVSLARAARWPSPGVSVNDRSDTPTGTARSLSLTTSGELVHWACMHVWLGGVSGPLPAIGPGIQRCLAPKDMVEQSEDRHRHTGGTRTPPVTTERNTKMTLTPTIANNASSEARRVS